MRIGTRKWMVGAVWMHFLKLCGPYRRVARSPFFPVWTSFGTAFVFLPLRYLSVKKQA
nr:hypothetical protein Q903MT_gene3965 [Picea sitchensis]